jgi:hypothetical protein
LPPRAWAASRSVAPRRSPVISYRGRPDLVTALDGGGSRSLSSMSLPAKGKAPAMAQTDQAWDRGIELRDE